MTQTLKSQQIFFKIWIPPELKTLILLIKKQNVSSAILWNAQNVVWASSCFFTTYHLLTLTTYYASCVKLIQPKSYFRSDPQMYWNDSKIKFSQIWNLDSN